MLLISLDLYECFNIIPDVQNALGPFKSPSVKHWRVFKSIEAFASAKIALNSVAVKASRHF
jgi:hypothetical protein